MAMWSTLLQLVPWSDVISNAPQIADGAKKLWSTVARSPAATGEQADHQPLPSADPKLVIAALQSRVDAMEVATTELHEQMRASAELIKTLAEQNTQLVQRIEVNRVRLTQLAVVTALIGLVAVTSLVLPLLR